MVETFLILLSHMKTYDNRKVVLGQGDDFTTVYLLISNK